MPRSCARNGRNVGYTAVLVFFIVVASRRPDVPNFDKILSQSQVTTVHPDRKHEGESTHSSVAVGSGVQDSLFPELDAGLPSSVSGCKGTAKLRKNSYLEHGETNLTRLAKLWAENALSVVSCPELLEIVVDRRRTPRVVHRIWNCDTIPKHYFPALHSWLEHSTDMFHLLWTSALREKLIAQKLGDHSLKLYRRLVPGAYSADFFRYFIMFHIGGVYSDVDTFLGIKLTEIKDFDTVTTMAIDIKNSSILNGAVLIAPSENSLFVCAMGEVLDHSFRRLYPSADGTGALDISGPGVLGECVRHVLGRDDFIFEPGRVHFGIFDFQLLKSLMLPNGGPHVVQFQDGSELLRLMPGGSQYERNVTPDCDPGIHYSTLYSQRKVYREDEQAA